MVMQPLRAILPPFCFGADCKSVGPDAEEEFDLVRKHRSVRITTSLLSWLPLAGTYISYFSFAPLLHLAADGCYTAPRVLIALVGEPHVQAEHDG